MIFPEGVTARAVITWLEVGAVDDPARRMENVVVGVGRAIVLPAGSSGTVPFELPVEGSSRVQVVAWLAPEGRGLASLFTPPAVSPPVRVGGETPVRLTLVEHDSGGTPAERCAGERRLLFDLPAPRGSGGGEPRRRLCALLPAGYEAEPEARYPVLLALPGIGGDHVNGLALAARDVLDRIAPETGDAIVVGVDLTTPYGASYLVDSTLTGPWDAFVAERVVAAIDARLRTVPDRARRAVIGHSTGGFDAVSIALRRPDVFGVVAASSPDALDFEAWMLDDTRRRARPLWHGWIRVEDQLGPPGQMTSYAADWSPSLDDPRAIRWPIDLESGEVIDEVWQLWLAQSPVTWLDDPEGLRRARRYDDHLYLTCGRPDEPLLFAPTERFHAALERVGITHAWEPTGYRHGEAAPERFEPLVRYVMERVRPPD